MVQVGRSTSKRLWRARSRWFPKVKQEEEKSKKNSSDSLQWTGSNICCVQLSGCSSLNDRALFILYPKFPEWMPLSTLSLAVWIRQVSFPDPKPPYILEGKLPLRFRCCSICLSIWLLLFRPSLSLSQKRPLRATVRPLMSNSNGEGVTPYRALPPLATWPRQIQRDPRPRQLARAPGGGLRAFHSKNKGGGEPFLPPVFALLCLLCLASGSPQFAWPRKGLHGRPMDFQ